MYLYWIYNTAKNWSVCIINSVVQKQTEPDRPEWERVYSVNNNQDRIQCSCAQISWPVSGQGTEQMKSPSGKVWTPVPCSVRHTDLQKQKLHSELLSDSHAPRSLTGCRPADRTGKGQRASPGRARNPGLTETKDIRTTRKHKWASSSGSLLTSKM